MARNRDEEEKTTKSNLIYCMSKLAESLYGGLSDDFTEKYCSYPGFDEEAIVTLSDGSNLIHPSQQDHMHVFILAYLPQGVLLMICTLDPATEASKDHQKVFLPWHAIRSIASPIEKQKEL